MRRRSWQVQELVQMKKDATASPEAVYRIMMQVEKAKEQIWCANFRQRQMLVEQLKIFKERQHQMQLCFICVQQMDLWSNDLGGLDRHGNEGAAAEGSAPGEPAADPVTTEEDDGMDLCGDNEIFPLKRGGDGLCVVIECVRPCHVVHESYCMRRCCQPDGPRSDCHPTSRLAGIRWCFPRAWR